MDPKPKGSTVREDFGAFTHETGHNWQPIRRCIWRKERLNRKMEMTMKERKQSCQMMKKRMGIQGFKMERITKWIQERLWFGDMDATIWGGLNGVGSEALEEQSKGGAEQGRKPRETKGFGRAYSRHSHNNKDNLSLPSHCHQCFRFCLSSTHPHGDDSAIRTTLKLSTQSSATQQLS